MALPRISVVVPSFNQARFLGEALDSILSQDYPGTEIIVMDGGSTDASVDVIRAREPRLAFWVSERDDGQSDALVRGFARSTGDVQCWLNADDRLEPGALAHVGDLFAQRRDVAALYGDATWIDERGDTLRVQREMPFNRFVWLYTYNYIPSTSMFWRRELYEQVGGIDASFDLAMDADLWARFSERTRLHHTRRVLSSMRFHLDQKTQAAGLDRRRAENERIVSRYTDSRSTAGRFARSVAARAIRIGWRAATGCYRLDYRPDLRRLLARRDAR